MSVVGGLDRDIKAKIAAKRDPVREAACMEWISTVAGANAANFQDDLKSGVYLCQLINALSPGSIRKINFGKTPFAQRENIEKYLDACVKYGVRSSDNFVTMDLFEGVKLNNVSDQIYCLSDVAVRKGFNGPALVEKFSRSRSVGNGSHNPQAHTANTRVSTSKPPPPSSAKPGTSSGAASTPDSQGFGQMCPSCGTNIGMKAKFCPECGERTIL